MTEKTKFDKPSPARINRYVFLLLWVLAQVVGWGVLFVFIQSDLLPYDNFLLTGLMVGLFLGIPSALLQKLVMRLHFGRNFKGWLRWSFLGWILGGIAIGLIEDIGGYTYNQLTIMLQVLALTLPASVAQAWVLRNYIQRSWLYVLATVAGSSIFALTLEEFGNNPEIGFFAFGAYAIATGLTLLWLFGMSSSIGKQKIAQSQETQHLEDTANYKEDINNQEDIAYKYLSS